MILSGNDSDLRLNSPDNLVNRLSALRNPVDLSVFTGGNDTTAIPEVINPAVFKDESFPSVDDLIDNVENKLKRNLAKEGALDVLVDTVNQLKTRLPEVQKPESLAKIAKEMQVVLSGLNNEDVSKKGNGNQTQVVIWKPVTVQEINYETVVVHED